jgi:hypothetical protein
LAEGKIMTELVEKPIVDAFFEAATTAHPDMQTNLNARRQPSLLICHPSTLDAFLDDPASSRYVTWGTFSGSVLGVPVFTTIDSEPGVIHQIHLPLKR